MSSIVVTEVDEDAEGTDALRVEEVEEEVDDEMEEEDEEENERGVVRCLCLSYRQE